MLMLATVLSVALFVGCENAPGGGDDDDAAGGKMATGEGPCEEAQECQGDICVALIDGDHPPVYCSEPCGNCPDGFFCDDQTFALVGLEFCRFGDSAESAPPPEEAPYLPCASDDDCEGDMVCAESGGEKGCATLCSEDSQCWISYQGLEMRFFECGPDESADRNVCLPDPDCFDGSIASMEECYEMPF